MLNVAQALATETYLANFMPPPLFAVIGKMWTNAFTSNSMGEGMGVNVFEMDIHVSTNFKQWQVCYRA